MVVNSKQIRFHQKGRVQAEEGPLSQARALICPEGNPPGGAIIWSQTHSRVRLWSWSGSDTTNC